MKGFIEGIGRDQVTLLPDCLDDYVEEDNPVRVVDAFIEMLVGWQNATFLLHQFLLRLCDQR